MSERIGIINAEAEAFYSMAAQVIRRIASDLEDEAPDPDDVDWPAGYEADESDDQLFQSDRDYVEQISFYKRHQGKPTGRRGKNGGAS
jgi:hypothetical protein